MLLNKYELHYEKKTYYIKTLKEISKITGINYNTIVQNLSSKLKKYTKINYDDKFEIQLITDTSKKIDSLSELLCHLQKYID